MFDPAVFGGDPQTPPVPMVICWDELDPAGYARTLRDLADWLDWLRRTYRLPYTVIPPCAGSATRACVKTSATCGPGGSSPATPTPASA